MPCSGAGTPDGDHCCYVDGERCRFLEDNVEGRRYSCSLRRTLGSWEAVHQDPGYIEHVQSAWDQVNARAGTIVIQNCGEWGPGTGQCCYKEA